MEQQNKSLKYIGYAIVCREVPDEVSIAFNISGCTHHCDGCHSKYLWVYEGKYLKDDIDCIINKYKGMVSCICFMGGDQNLKELADICERIKNKYNLKVCVYSGCDTIDYEWDVLLRNRWIDYIKIGKYKKECGGLDKEDTNQIMYQISYSGDKALFKDITYRFKKPKN